MHTVSFAYPEDPSQQEKDTMYNFMNAFAAVIPCKRCRLDWQNFLQTHLSSSFSEHLKNRESFSKFVVDGHNYVNRKLGKSEVDYMRVLSWYDPRSATSDFMQFKCLFIILFAVIAALYFGSKLKSCAQRAIRQPELNRF